MEIVEEKMKSTVAKKIENGTCENVKLFINEACLNVYSQTDIDLTFYAGYDDCYMCNDLKVDQITPNSINSFIIQTSYPVRTHFKNSKYEVCYNTFRYVENGVYGWNFTNDSCNSIVVEKEPTNVILEIILIFACYFLPILFFYVMKRIYESNWLRNCFRRTPFTALADDLGNPDTRDASELARRRKRDTRITSLDCLRGIAIVSMIFVNYGGGQYSFFEHTPWNGLTLADLVFPWFVWTMGFSIALSLRSQLRTSVTRRKIFMKVTSRSFMLIILGIMMNSSKSGKPTDLLTLRLPGVLQRLGLVYFVVGTIETVFMKPQGHHQYGPWYICQDLIESWFQWLLIILLTLVNVLITFLLPVPDCPTGYQGPGGLHYNSSYTNCTGGAAGYIDRLVFGESHIYQHPTSHKVYMSDVPYDPEGILGLFTSILLAYLGVQAARIMFFYHQNMSRISRWLIWISWTGLAAGFLCKWSKEDGIIPVNKNLWSLSYVLTSASITLFMFLIIYIIVDVKHWWTGTPFIYPGMNPILLYIGHMVFKSRLPFKWQPLFGHHMEYLVMDLYATTLWVVFSYFCYRKNYFLIL